MSELTREQQTVLAALDDVRWMAFREITGTGLGRHKLLGVLRALRHKGLVDYRRSDADGQGEWSRVEEWTSPPRGAPW